MVRGLGRQGAVRLALHESTPWCLFGLFSAFFLALHVTRCWTFKRSTNDQRRFVSNIIDELLAIRSTQTPVWQLAEIFVTEQSAGGKTDQGSGWVRDPCRLGVRVPTSLQLKRDTPNLKPWPPSLYRSLHMHYVVQPENFQKVMFARHNLS